MNNNEGFRGLPCPTPVELIQEDVFWYSRAMEDKLMIRRDYGYWNKDTPYAFVLKRLKQEVEELSRAIAQSQAINSWSDYVKATRDIMDEAADVGNFAMMAFTLAKREVGA